MNKTQIVANWKMNTTISDSINISTKLSNASLDINNIDITICPPALYLAQVHQILKNSSLKIGAQNIHSEEEGAYTGEISAKMISDYCDTVILGHSERRQIFKESNQDINKKFLLAKKFNLNSIICVGETVQERESGKAKKIVSTQILSALKSASDFNKLLIAYEPVWAIGTGKAATTKDAQDMCSYIRNVITELNKNNVAENLSLIHI